MTAEELRTIAEAHVAGLNGSSPPHAQIKFGIGEMTEFLTCYYFDFRLLDANDQEYKEPPVAGAPGFIVSKNDKQAKTISLGDLGALKRREVELTEIYQMLADVKERNTSLMKLKSKYDLTSKQLLCVKRLLDDHEIDRNSSEELITEILKDI
ncbi:hypothetical protein KK083_04830 [Fulvivirgaceae bacterium PWU4]|uniref:Uncharacterized protein n=1 Tax=Chryseosolibacter histidini TaxID=2782349 RepID=A0AAP2GHM3_9BACT|nr:hypothetical protein [Chryseosolibacter histidini]MBT1696186.1 hypothetical protein [Chryseosolibacter histidini]